MKIPIIALRVLDQQRALDFYTETLGFTVTEEGITVLGKGQAVEGSYTGPPLRP